MYYHRMLSSWDEFAEYIRVNCDPSLYFRRLVLPAIVSLLRVHDGTPAGTRYFWATPYS